MPARAEVVCYRTRSGYCPRCKARVESRHPQQPPAADLPHAQLGINAALAEAAALRVEDRLPMRTVCAVLGRSGCGCAPPRSPRRCSGWRGGWAGSTSHQAAGAAFGVGQRRRDGLAHRRAQHVAVGRMRRRRPPTRCTTSTAAAPARAARGLLGENFGGTVGCDFYGAYDAAGFAKKQRCLAHLLRELRDTARDSPGFAGRGLLPAVPAAAQGPEGFKSVIVPRLEHKGTSRCSAPARRISSRSGDCLPG